MSPIDKNELRDELRRAGADAPASPELGPLAIARGRAIRRRRGVVATAAVAVVAVSGATLWATLPREPREAVPIQTPTLSPTPSASPTVSDSPTPTPPPTAAPTPSGTPSAPGTIAPRRTPSGAATTTAPRPTGSGTARPSASGTAPAARWGKTIEAPGRFGDLGTFRLAGDAAPGRAASGWTAQDSTILYCSPTGRVTLSAMADVVAGRNLVSAEGESTRGQGVLLFATEASARSFLAQVRAGVEACGKQQPSAGAEGDGRQVMSVSTPSGLGQQALVTGGHAQMYVGGAWTDAPGGDATLWVRQGRAVTYALEGGEFLGPVWSGRADIAAELRGTVQQALPQLCPLQGGC